MQIATAKHQSRYIGIWSLLQWLLLRYFYFSAFLLMTALHNLVTLQIGIRDNGSPLLFTLADLPPDIQYLNVLFRLSSMIEQFIQSWQ